MLLSMLLMRGLEMDMMSHAYDRHLKELVEEGKVTMAQVDESVVGYCV